MIGTTGVYGSRTDAQDGARAGCDRQSRRQLSSQTDTVQRPGRYQQRVAGRCKPSTQLTQCYGTDDMPTVSLATCHRRPERPEV